MTLVFGVLNLIVAVIVDVFAESRDKDVFARASELEEEECEQKAVLGQIFKRIDTDGEVDVCTCERGWGRRHGGGCCTRRGPCEGTASHGRCGRCSRRERPCALGGDRGGAASRRVGAGGSIEQSSRRPGREPRRPLA